MRDQAPASLGPAMTAHQSEYTELDDADQFGGVLYPVVAKLLGA